MFEVTYTCTYIFPGETIYRPQFLISNKKVCLLILRIQKGFKFWLKTAEMKWDVKFHLTSETKMSFLSGDGSGESTASSGGALNFFSLPHIEKKKLKSSFDILKFWLNRFLIARELRKANKGWIKKRLCCTWTKIKVVLYLD